MEDMLTQALKTRLPFVHISTDDIVHTGEVLSFIAGEEVKPIDLSKIGEMASFPAGNVFYTNYETPTPKLYLLAKENKKCIVFVNTKTNVLHFNGGVMFPPKDLMKSFLMSLMTDVDEATAAKMAEAVLPAFGGLTLKDMYEVAMLTLKREGNLTPHGINATRQGYITKLKGITQIDTKYPYYQCPSQLQDWMDANLPFFQIDTVKELTPRGLLFDGPPGTGKTMGAKHIAQHLGVPLYHLDIGGMKGKYVGDSEGNLHAALAQVDQVQPCVVLFDEVEKIFVEQSDSGVTSSLLGTLLWWLQEHTTKVFTVMTTNAKAKIPPELYREGRIDQTMMFNGIDSIEDAMEFSKQTFNATAKNVFQEEQELDLAVLKSQLKILYSEGYAVPQVKIANVVHSIIKKMLMEGAK